MRQQPPGTARARDGERPHVKMGLTPGVQPRGDHSQLSSLVQLFLARPLTLILLGGGRENIPASVEMQKQPGGTDTGNQKLNERAG